MGVNGLLRLLQPISVPRQVGHFQGQTLGVDGYAWLHRAAASCADDLVRNTDTTKLVQSIDRRIRLYEAAGVNLYFVFDGAHTEMKARVSAQRRRVREQAKAAYLLNQSQNVLGGVSITPEHAAMVVAYLKARGIRFVVAPYEADSQLVWLEKNGLVDGILSEDGDLLVFGASRLITKADGRTGDCVEVCAHRLPPHFSAAGMRALAIIAGCDYSQGVAGLGPIKTSALVKSYAGDLMAICTSLLRSGRVDEQFVEEARRADLAFQFQRVWDPNSCNVVHLNDPLESGVDTELLLDTIIGPLLPRPDAHRIARCVVDPNNPSRALPVSPAVAHFVARLPPLALATPSKYSSSKAIKSIMDRRLPATPCNNMRLSPFFRQKSSSTTAGGPIDAEKENMCGLPTPPTSIASMSSSSLKRSREDIADSSSPVKAVRTDTIPDVSASPVSPVFKNTLVESHLSPLEQDRQPLIESRSASQKANIMTRSTLVSVKTQSASANAKPGSFDPAHTTQNTMEKLAALRQFAYSKS